MNIPMWLCWTVVGLLVVFSLILLAGKGSCLIAGYNTSNREKKQKYNEKRLCRVVGAGMGILATIIGIATFYRFELPPFLSWIIPWGILGTIVIVEVLASTICKRKPSSTHQQ